MAMAAWSLNRVRNVKGSPDWVSTWRLSITINPITAVSRRIGTTVWECAPANRPGVGLAHGPIQSQPHCASHIQAGIEFPVDPLHDREFFHAGAEFLVGQGIQAGVIDGNRGL